MKDTTIYLVSATPLKPLDRISLKFVVMKDITCRCAFPQEILIPLFFLELRHFRNLTKIKDSTETVDQRNFSEAAQQNFLKLRSNERHNV